MRSGIVGGAGGGGGADPSLLSPGQDLAWLMDMLRSVQLEQFYVRIRDQLQVSRLEHFEFVAVEDLEKVRIMELLGQLEAIRFLCPAESHNFSYCYFVFFLSLLFLDWIGPSCRPPPLGLDQKAASKSSGWKTFACATTTKIWDAKKILQAPLVQRRQQQSRQWPAKSRSKRPQCFPFFDLSHPR